MGLLTGGVKQPGLVGVPAPQGQGGFHRGHGSAPGGAGVKGGDHAHLFQQGFQVPEVVLPAGACGDPLSGGLGGLLPRGAGVHELVVQLGGDDGPPLGEVQPVHLGVDGGVQALYRGQEPRVPAADLIGFAVEPVGQAAVAHLPVGEGPHPEDHIEAVLLAQLYKGAQIPVAVKAEDALHLLMDVPEHVGGHNVHPAHFGLDESVLPLVGCHPGVVDLSAYAKVGLTVQGHETVGKAQQSALGVLAGEGVSQGENCGGRNMPQVQGMCHSNASFGVVWVMKLV